MIGHCYISKHVFFVFCFFGKAVSMFIYIYIYIYISAATVAYNMESQQYHLLLNVGQASNINIGKRHHPLINFP